MKKTLLSLFMLSLTLNMISAQDCTSSIDGSAISLGFNPNPLPTCYAGIDYDHVNTIVLPRFVDNSLTPAPGDSIELCGVRILSVTVDSIFSTPFPAGFTFSWEVWQNNVQVDTNEVINIYSVGSYSRACIRIKSLNPPVPLSPQDVLVINVAVRGMIDLDGPGAGPCFDVPPPAGDQSFQFTFLLENNFASIDEDDHANPAIFAYPNPFTDYIRISNQYLENNSGMVTITDMNGKVLQSMKVQNNSIISTSELAAGLYIIKLTSGEQVYLQKIIK